MAAEHTGWKRMKRKFPILVHNCMPCVCTPLKPHDNIRILRHHIGDLAFSFVTPVGPYDCFYHDSSIPCRPSAGVLFSFAVLLYYIKSHK